jgi:hypothetical protein
MATDKQQDDLQANVWDKILASARQQENTPTSRPSWQMPLTLAEKPNRRHLTPLFRNEAMIPQILQAAIRSLVRGEAPWPLFLSGSIGTGKTCAGLCLVDHCDGEYFTVSSLCTLDIEAMKGILTWKCLTGVSPQAGDGLVGVERLWAWLASKKLIVLDELGCREKVTDHHYDCVKRMLDERLGRPLVLIANVPLDGIERLYDDRVASRMAAGTVVRLDGDDRRVTGK